MGQITNTKSTLAITNRIDHEKILNSYTEKVTRGGTMMADYTKRNERTDEISFNNSLVVKNGFKGKY